MAIGDPHTTTSHAGDLFVRMHWTERAGHSEETGALDLVGVETSGAGTAHIELYDGAVLEAAFDITVKSSDWVTWTIPVPVQNQIAGLDIQMQFYGARVADTPDMEPGGDTRLIVERA